MPNVFKQYCRVTKRDYSRNEIGRNFRRKRGGSGIRRSNRHYVDSPQVSAPQIPGTTESTTQAAVPQSPSISQSPLLPASVTNSMANSHIDYEIAPDMNDFDDFQEPIPPISAPIRTSQRRKVADNASFDAISKSLRSSIRDSVNVMGDCTVPECTHPAWYRSPSAITRQMFCANHANSAIRTFPDLIDADGIPYNHTGSADESVLLIDPNSWRYVAKGDNDLDDYSVDYLPGSGQKPTVFFHKKIMAEAFLEVKKGLAANRIWGSVLERFKFPLEREVYLNFLNLLQNYVCWRILDEELEFESDELVPESDTDSNQESDNTKRLLIVNFFSEESLFSGEQLEFVMKLFLDSFKDQFAYEFFNTAVIYYIQTHDGFEIALGYRRPNLVPCFEPPQNEGHWRLAIIEVTNDKTQKDIPPKIRISLMESFYSKKRLDRTYDIIVEYLIAKYNRHLKGNSQPISIDNFVREKFDPNLYPQQTNEYDFDCGPFVVYYTWLYFTRKNFASTYTIKNIYNSIDEEELEKQIEGSKRKNNWLTNKDYCLEIFGY